MAIAASSSTIVHQTWIVPATGRRQSMIEFLSTQLAAAGWTVTDSYPFSYLYTPFDLNMTNGETFTIAGRTYTYVNALSSADDILIGGSASASFDNTVAAINKGAGEGTVYGTGTTINANVTASRPATYSGHQAVLMTGKDYGELGTSVTESGANLAWSAATLGGLGLNLVSATTPSFQRVDALVNYTSDGSGDSMYFYLLDRDRQNSTEVCRVDGNGNDSPILDTGVNWTFIGNKYQFFFFAENLAATNASAVMFCAPFMPTILSPKKITGATNATPIVITTSAAHGYTTGDSVLQKYVEGNTAANGTFTITVTGTDTYSLNGSVGNGAFTGTDGLAANQTAERKEFLEIVLGNGSTSVGSWITYREDARLGTSGGSALRNGVLIPKSSGSSNWVYGFLTSLLPTWLWTTDVAWENAALFAGEPWIGVSTAAATTDPKLGVMPWDCFISQTSTDGAFTTTADGSSWRNVVHNSGASDATGYAKLAWWLLLP